MFFSVEAPWAYSCCSTKVSFFLFIPNLNAYAGTANLLPRRGRNKPGRDGEDMERGVAGEAKKYGCVALDNLYNIMHTTDRKKSILSLDISIMDTDISN
jgi:hypothetical protein